MLGDKPKSTAGDLIGLIFVTLLVFWISSVPYIVSASIKPPESYPWKDLYSHTCHIIVIAYGIQIIGVAILSLKLSFLAFRIYKEDFAGKYE